ncbi:MAG: AMP-binding protein [Chloroflexi bacterium]|nr:AMP-binding protein [Chloroflexota bacterium]
MKAQTIPQAIHRQVRAQPDKEALVFLAADGVAQPVTYARLHADAQAVGQSLLEQGVRPGELVILAFDNGYPLVAAFFGTMYAGAVPSIFPYFTAQSPPKVYRGRVQQLVRQTQAGAVITLSGLRTMLTAVLMDTSYRVITIDDEAAGNRASDKFVIHQAGPGDVAYIQFSSGSTGVPKGVCISHRAALSTLDSLAIRQSFGPADVAVGWGSFHHTMGLVRHLLLPLLFGGQTIVMDPHSWLRDPASLFRAVHRFRGTITCMPTFAFAHCAQMVRETEIQGLDLSSWRVLGCAAEPIQVDTLKKFVARFSPYGLRPRALAAGYGLSENTVNVSQCPPNQGLHIDSVSQTVLSAESRARPVSNADRDALAVVSCGTPLASTEVAIIDDGGRPLPERHVGEICIRGDSLFSGYYRQPEATAQAMQGGWLHTGDRGYLAGGELYVVGRKKDLIISAGQNIYPHYVEEIAQAAVGPQAQRAAAFGIRDERLGTELPVAVVELRGRVEDAERETLVAKIRQRVQEEVDVHLADVRLVRTGWVKVTTSGKVARAANRQKYLDAGFRPPFSDLFGLDLSANQPVAALEGALMRIVAAVTGKTDLDPQANLDELGVDSLAMVQVLLLIEENLGRPVPMEQLAKQPTIHYLARLLQDGSRDTATAPAAAAPEDVYPIGPRGVRKPAAMGPWRWRRNRLLQRGPALRGRALPYGLGTRLLRAVASRPSLRQTFYPREIALLQRCLESVPVQSDPEDVLRLNLMVNSWANWRRLALADDAAFAHWVTVRGEEVLERAEGEGRGAVLVFHHTELKKVLRRLPVLQGRDLAIIGNVGAATLTQSGLPHLAKAVARGETLSTTAVRSAQLVRALQTLRAGGLAYVAADDDDGRGGIHVSFHGRWRPFRPGAAELALQSGAAFVPVFASMDLAGHIAFEFLEPLTPEGASHQAQVESLLHGYADLLIGRYTTDLGAMEWYILRKFLRLPAVGVRSK